MDWRTAVEEVAKYAPAVATAIGGPGVGGITAGAASMVTGLLGVENSPAGLVAATQDPEKRAELIRINNEHREKLERMRLDAEAAHAAEETARLAEINKTIRAELGTDGWWRAGWRPFNGWMLALSLASVNLGLVAVVIMDPARLAEVVDVLIWSVVAQGAVQGVNIRQRSNDKARQLGQAPRTFLDALKLRK